MDKKKIIAVDVILIVGSLIVLAIIVGYAAPLIIFQHEGISDGESVLFEFVGERILIDDNPEFSSPDEFIAKDGLVISMNSGVYYWNVRKDLYDEIMKFTVEEDIELGIKEIEGGFAVVNAGDVELDVGVYSEDELIGNLVLDVEELVEVRK